MMLRRLFRKNVGVETKASASSLAFPDAFTFGLFGSIATSSGVSVTPQTAMSVPAVRGCILAIAEACGQLPLHVFQRAGDASKVRDTTHAAAKVLQGQFNDWTTAQEARQQLVIDACLHGTGYAFINRVDGEVVEMIRLAPETVVTLINYVTSEPFYQHTPLNGEMRVIPHSDMYVIRAPSITGYVPAAPIVSCNDAIGLAILLQRAASQLFAKGPRPGGTLKPGATKLDAGTIQRLRESITTFFSGASSGNVLVLEDGAEFEALQFSSVDSQFAELWTHSVNEICRVFRVPPSMVAELGRATHANATENNRQFLQLTLRPWLERFEQEARKLFTPDERNTFFAEFNVDDLLKTDLTVRAEGYATLIASRIMSPNEARALENLPPYAGGETFENPNTSSAPSSAANDNAKAETAA